MSLSIAVMLNLLGAILLAPYLIPKPAVKLIENMKEIIIRKQINIKNKLLLIEKNMHDNENKNIKHTLNFLSNYIVSPIISLFFIINTIPTENGKIITFYYNEYYFINSIFVTTVLSIFLFIHRYSKKAILIKSIKIELFNILYTYVSLFVLGYIAFQCRSPLIAYFFITNIYIGFHLMAYVISYFLISMIVEILYKFTYVVNGILIKILTKIILYFEYKTNRFIGILGLLCIIVSQVA